jgi:hypothetical protein
VTTAEIFGTLETRIRRDNTKLCFNNFNITSTTTSITLFIADTGNLAVTTTSVPNYPFGHAFHFETDTGRQGVFITSTTASITLKHTLDSNSLTKSINSSMNRTGKN